MSDDVDPDAEGMAAADNALNHAELEGAEASASEVSSIGEAPEKGGMWSTEPDIPLDEVQSFPWDPERGGSRRVWRGILKYNGGNIGIPAVVDLAIGPVEWYWVNKDRLPTWLTGSSETEAETEAEAEASGSTIQAGEPIGDTENPEGGIPPGGDEPI